jgi:branched-subunit amino acid aminotransferase/4-amino-4-deoxychorismate lyase
VAFYHGGLNAIITDPRLMCISFLDKQVQRGYSVFDTCNIFNSRLYLFEKHMNRFSHSMKVAKLQPPKTSAEIKQIFFTIANLVGQKSLNFRYWCSRGGQDLDITSKSTSPTVFYCVAMKGRPVQIAKGMADAYTTTTEVKGRALAEIKTTNYMLNCLAAEEAKRKGGLAIMKTEDGYVTEGSVQAVGFVLKDKTFYAPPYVRALRSITMDRVLELIEKHLIPSDVVSKISRVKMTVDQLKEEVAEMMLLGGERVVPIRKWDELVISEKEGPVTEKIMQLLEDDYTNSEVTIQVTATSL